MYMAKILVVDDDVDLCNSVSDALSLEQHSVECSFEGKDAFERLLTGTYDLIVLDLALPAMSGIEICRELRSRNVTTPIIMLTGRRTTAEKEEGLDSGADDYITKPFDLRELIARVRAVLRRATPQAAQVIKIRDIELDPIKRTVLKAGTEIDLLPKEFALLEYFLAHPDHVLSQEALLNKVWQSDSGGSPEALRSCVKRLRKKIDHDESRPLIQTVHGVGYRLHSK